MLLIKNGTLLTMKGSPREGEDILIKGGKIAQIGPNLDAPEGAKIIDAEGKTVMPGMIDAHTHIGISEEGIGFEGSDFNEITSPITPELRAIDAINPSEEGVKDARTNGITSVVTGPGSANVIGGQSLAMKTVGEIIDQMVIKDPVGLKAAFGENPKRVYSSQSKNPSTRMATAAQMRKAFFDASEYLKKVEEHEQKQEQEDENKDSKGPDKDFKKEVLIKVLKGELTLRAHAHRADDIMTAIRIAKEFEFPISIEHCTEGHKVAGELKKHDIPAVVGPSMTSRAKVELRDRTFETPRVLHEDGVKFAITTDHPVIPIYTLPFCAGLAVREGLPWEEALKAVTINAAEIAEIDHRVGSLEVGKDGDVLVFDGDPLSLDPKLEHVFINGEEVTRDQSL
ncbi:amidohydrolase [Natranaerobius thermophilus]|uniref:Amidohydrolase n=1 Tax=Natranaerobius thermophilus (strain ATCC BAA-1301 / DSM 18059 / JW/NM-WN-LF) TaxID=457570 RepID=B2A8F8_NATTJ|nr:amidohydrolase [Natranaerobius thermophilus]ACB85842.1 amidohydrolase [Natranaerobius thermophilus JW/NM-WN-LF]